MSTAVSHPPCIQSPIPFTPPFQDLIQTSPSVFKASYLFTFTHSSQGCSFFSGGECHIPAWAVGLSDSREVQANSFCNHWSDKYLQPESELLFARVSYRTAI